MWFVSQSLQYIYEQKLCILFEMRFQSNFEGLQSVQCLFSSRSAFQLVVANKWAVCLP